MADPEIGLDRIDEAVLALMFLTLHKDRKWEPWRTWKSFDWAAMGRLHEKDLIFDPVSKAKSVVLTDEGYKRCEGLLSPFHEAARSGSDRQLRRERLHFHARSS